mmetsp:Transcript_29750/g.68500  ORF Transcript_29750/g.68500 Transcript_29750/m.68500 type:complete len:223 (+) Transcript_29750:577-1245(+)
MADIQHPAWMGKSRALATNGVLNHGAMWMLASATCLHCPRCQHTYPRLPTLASPYTSPTPLAVARTCGQRRLCRWVWLSVGASALLARKAAHRCRWMVRLWTTLQRWAVLARHGIKHAIHPARCRLVRSPHRGVAGAGVTWIHAHAILRCCQRCHYIFRTAPSRASQSTTPIPLAVTLMSGRKRTTRTLASTRGPSKIVKPAANANGMESSAWARSLQICVG